MYVAKWCQWDDDGMNTQTLSRGTKEALTVVCAWCGTCLSRGGPQVSHGMCKACAANFLKAN